MKNGKKFILRIAVAMMCAAMAVSALPAAAFADDVPVVSSGEGQNTVSGNCGATEADHVQWSFDETTGTLTISGTGAMVNYNDSTDEESVAARGTYPWSDTSLKDKVKNGTTRIVIEDGVTSVGTKAFIAWPNVTSVSIGKDVSEIGAGAFAQLTSCNDFTVAVENTNFTTDNGVLYGTENGVKTKLCYYPCAKTDTSFVIPNTVTLLGYNALCRATNLTSVTFEEGGTEGLTLGFGCFAYDTRLTSITLPARTEKICSSVFGNCNSLTTYDCGSVEVYALLMTSNCGKKDSSTVTVNGSSYTDMNDSGYSFVPIGDEAVITGYTGSDTELEIPSVVKGTDGKEYTVTEIGPEALWNNSDNSDARNITSIIIPESVKVIDRFAFSGSNSSHHQTNSLQYIKIKSDTITIGVHAFSRNTALTMDMSDVKTVNVKTDSYRTHFAYAQTILVNNESIAKQLVNAIGANTRIYVAPRTEYSPYWYADAKFNGSGSSATYTPQYSGDHTLTFNYADGSTNKVVKVIPDGVYPLSKETAPTRTGYTFAGWYNGDTKVEGESLTVGKDITLTAKWTANPYTIKFDPNGGTGTIKDQRATYDADVTLPENTFTNGDKIFIGWATSADGQVVYADKATVKNLTADGEVTLYAVWAVKSVPINPATPVIPSEPTVMPSVSNGWKDVSQGTVYYKNGVKVKGWQKIDGETYYFDQKGVLQTGWLNLDGHWYRLDNTGAMQTGWVKVGKSWYFMEENGVMDAATWLSDGGKWYYLGADGAMYSNKWRCTKGVWYYLLGNGEMAKNRWIEDKGNWYYLGADGGMLVDTTTPDGYRVDENGVWIKK